jgi:cysteine desulfurase / selenocysteine lyase
MSASAAVRRPGSGYDVEAVRRDFPILETTVHGKPLIYLDSAASAQKPRAVIEAEKALYESYYSNIHRGVHQLSVLSTDAYEKARGKAQRFLNARESREVIFVRSTTEAINLVAQAWGRKNVGNGDEVLISALEHHSNIVPWQMLCEEREAVLRVAPIDDTGTIDLEAYEKLLSPRTKIVSVAHVSNALGTINPIKKMTALAHAQGAVVMIDGAQGAPHVPLDVQDLDTEFYAFSGHKVYGPSGIGVLHGKARLLEAMPPWQGGGDMIASVTFEKTTYNVLPHKFEAGTPNIAGTVGFGAALDYVTSLGVAAIGAHEHELLVYGTELLSRIPGLRLVGTAKEKAGVLSFVLEGIHPHDIGTVLDYEGIAVRTGHHCAQPVMDRFSLPATARASLACFNTRAELDALAAGIRKVQEMFR